MNTIIFYLVKGLVYYCHEKRVAKLYIDNINKTDINRTQHL